jgi:uncharacterized protein (DUF849 family)
MTQPTIIEVALNGGLSKRRNPAVPRSPEEVHADAVRCIDAGASIVHSHTDDPVLSGTGEHDPSPYLAAWREILSERPDTLLYPTMPGGRADVPVARRYAHVEALHDAGVLGLGLVDPGSTNFGRIASNGAPQAGRLVYINTFEDAIYMTETCRQMGVGVSVSVFEPGFLRFVVAYQQAGRLPRGTIIKLYFGGDNVLFGFPERPLRTALAGLDAYLALLEPTGLPWMVSIQGGDIVASGLAEEAIQRGGHVQVGLEPSGDCVRTNVDLVAEAASLAESLGRQPATADDTATLLGLPNRAQRADLA